MTDEMTNDKYLDDTGTPLSIVPHKSNIKPSGPLLRGENGLPIPSWSFITKAIHPSHRVFSKLLWQDPF